MGSLTALVTTAMTIRKVGLLPSLAQPTLLSVIGGNYEGRGILFKLLFLFFILLLHAAAAAAATTTAAVITTVINRWMATLSQ